MLLYDNFTPLLSYKIFTSLGVEYIRATFNMNTNYKIHVVAIDKPTMLLLSTFVINLTKYFESNTNFLSNSNY